MPITITIPVSQQLSASSNTPQNAPTPFRNKNCGRGRELFGKGGRRGNGSGSGGAISNNLVSVMLIVRMLPL